MPDTRPASPLYRCAQIRAIEAQAQSTLAPGTLMRRAGLAAATLAQQMLGQRPGQGAKVLALAGPGNNGGDALEAVHHLAQAGVDVTVLLFADPRRYSADAASAFARASAAKARIVDTDQLETLAAGKWSLVIDGLFGIGLQRPLAGLLRTLVESVNALPCPRLALDLPSGLDADSGNVVGGNAVESGVAIRASQTLTFLADKPGLHTGAGRDHAGQVSVDHLGIDPALFPAAQLHVNAPALFLQALPQRRHASHKGTHGSVAILGGASGMGGAVILSGRSALYCGAGRVYAGFLGPAPDFDPVQPELMCRAAQALLSMAATTAIGPGLGTSSEAAELLRQSLQTQEALVVDADALNLLAQKPTLQRALAQRTAPTLLTPHPLEAARLLGSDAATIQDDRLRAAAEIARRFNAIAILKGSGSIIAHPNGAAVINSSGNPGLASAGTGDVLTGICAALLAQAMPPWEAALAAVWIHGAAADRLLAQGTGPIGLCASELMPAMRAVINRLAARAASA